MSILVQVLLTLPVLSACLGDVVTPSPHTLRTKMLKETMKLLDRLQQEEVSCNKMNVINIFADHKRFIYELLVFHVSAIGLLKPLMKENSSQRGNNTEILCRAATIAREGQSCHRYLGGIYDNLLSLAWGSTARHKKPCPVAEGSTTSLKNFLKELHHVLQEEYKSRK